MIEIIFETGINLIETLISTDFITKYLGTKYDGAKKYIGFCVCWFATFAELCIINSIVEFETLAVYIPIIIYFIYAGVCLKGGIWLKLWMSFLTQLMIYGIAVISNLIICNIIGYDPNDMITVFDSTRIIGVIISKIIQFYATRIILRTKHKNPMNSHYGLMLIIIPAVSLISLGALMKATFYNSEIRLYIIIGVACIILADIMTYYFFIVINKEYENTIKAKLLEQQNENLKNNIDDNEAFVNEMKAVRHDIKHQLLTILKYIDDNKLDEAKAYIGVLTNNYLPHILSYIDTGNTVFDAVVNSKIAICNQKHIFMEVNIKSGTDFKIPQAEMAILFGNLLDNAIEAAEFTDEKRITLDIRTNEGYLIISVKNSIKSSVLHTNEELTTSKSDKKLHGIGIKSIKGVVNKYNGMIQFYEEENQFCCHIMITINE